MEESKQQGNMYCSFSSKPFSQIVLNSKELGDNCAQSHINSDSLEKSKSRPGSAEEKNDGLMKWNGVEWMTREEGGWWKECRREVGWMTIREEDRWME